MHTEIRFGHLYLPPSQKQILRSLLFSPSSQYRLSVSHLSALTAGNYFRVSAEAVGFPNPAPKTQKL